MGDFKLKALWAVRHGNEETIREYIDRYGLSPWSNGYLLLREALKHNEVNIANLLLERGAAVTSQCPTTHCTSTPFHFAARYNLIEIMTKLVEMGADLYSTNQSGEYPLHVAVKSKNFEATHFLLSLGASPNVITNPGQSGGVTPLFIAVENGDIRIAELLLFYGASTWASDHNYSLLYLACAMGNTKLVELLLDRSVDDINFSPIHAAIENGQKAVVELLLERGAHVDSEDGYGNSVLHYAFKHYFACPDSKAIFHLLLDRGAHIDMYDQLGKTILYIAVENKKLALVKKILKYNPDRANTKNVKCLELAITGCSDNPPSPDSKLIVEALLAYGFSVSVEYISASRGSLSPLWIAININSLRLIELLVRCGADVNVNFRAMNWTPLHLAVFRGSQEIISLLLRNGADVNAKDGLDMTALHIAAEMSFINVAGESVRDSEMINMFGQIVGFTSNQSGFGPSEEKRDTALVVTELLLLAGAATDIVDKNGNTVLNTAVKRGHLALVLSILQYHPDQKCNKYCMETAMRSYSVAKFEIVDALDKRGCVPASIDPGFPSFLYATVGYGFSDIFRKVFNKDVLNSLPRDMFLLHEAIKIPYDCQMFGKSYAYAEKIVASVEQRCWDIFMLLIENGVDVNASDSLGNTPLHVICEQKFKNLNARIAECLLSNGAKVDSKDGEGHTPLYLAARLGLCKVVPILLKYKADVNCRTNYGMTPLIAATEFQHCEVVKLLLDGGARVDIKDRFGSTALHLATGHENKEIMKVLLAYDADVNCKDREGYTPLHVAARGIHKLLLEYGADINIEKSGSTNFVYEKSLYEEHILKMKTANIYISQNILKYYSGIEEDLSELKADCEVEVAKMMSLKISKSKVSFYDFLKKNSTSLLVNMRNVHFVDALNSQNYRDIFPLYAILIRSQIRKGLLRLKLHEQGLKMLNIVFANLPCLPEHCLELILNNLSDEQLRIFLDCY